ncbi:hypothetical protein DSO57_1005121 [Entomophthora muscae]|uniref:Uncharacterized protein n=1 Tax=Entomophthora muscae TaxID=34485 RepID=A0ACC2S9X1_9FUNG|nr:hypothetical protein DSO57_1005121 [Entomophthora muscae]
MESKVNMFLLLGPYLRYLTLNLMLYFSNVTLALGEEALCLLTSPFRMLLCICRLGYSIWPKQFKSPRKLGFLSLGLPEDTSQSYLYSGWLAKLINPISVRLIVWYAEDIYFGCQALDLVGWFEVE